jgi:hypothetical protein
VRSVLPKGYAYELKAASPTKAAAISLRKKAARFQYQHHHQQQHSPLKRILPKNASSSATLQVGFGFRVLV